MNSDIATIYRITSGISNVNYKITIDGIPYFMRHGDHKHEYEILNQLKDCEWIPKIFRYTSNNLIMNWIDGYHLNRFDAILISNLVNNIQKIKLNGINVFDIKRELEICLNYHDNKLMPYLHMMINKYLPDYTKPSTLVLCHLDIHNENILIDNDNKPYLIDWEFTCMGDPLLDIASYTITENLSKEDMELLFNSYNVLGKKCNWIDYITICRLIGIYWTFWHIKRSIDEKITLSYFNNIRNMKWLF